MPASVSLPLMPAAFALRGVMAAAAYLRVKVLPLAVAPDAFSTQGLSAASSLVSVSDAITVALLAEPALPILAATGFQPRHEVR